MHAKCWWSGYLMLRRFGAEDTDMVMECFQGIKIKELHRMIETKHLGSPETVIIHMGTNDLRTTRNLDFVVGEENAF